MDGRTKKQNVTHFSQISFEHIKNSLDGNYIDRIDSTGWLKCVKYAHRHSKIKLLLPRNYTHVVEIYRFSSAEQGVTGRAMAKLILIACWRLSSLIRSGSTGKTWGRKRIASIFFLNNS